MAQPRQAQPSRRPVPGVLPRARWRSSSSRGAAGDDSLLGARPRDVRPRLAGRGRFRGVRRGRARRRRTAGGGGLGAGDDLVVDRGGGVPRPDQPAPPADRAPAAGRRPRRVRRPPHPSPGGPRHRACWRRRCPRRGHSGLEQVLITCDVDNVGSRAVIEANGGVLEDRRGAKLRYWVPRRRPLIRPADSGSRALHGKMCVRRTASRESSPCPHPQPRRPERTDPAIIRNFCIIAHIDHGKSTLADRMLQLTGVVDERAVRAQYLDRMDIERERGITIKSQAVRMPWTVREATTSGAEPGTYVLNMIDTPGHVDFTYEVSRSLAACEGAVLLVDAAQGIEAQTLANLYLALETTCTSSRCSTRSTCPAPAGEVRRGAGRDHRLRPVRRAAGLAPRPAWASSTLLDEIVRQIPPPVGDADAPPRALIFDSVYDTYRGVVTYVRVIDGRLTPRDRIKMMSTGAVHELLEVGVISPEPVKAGELGVGEVGYLITGVKDVRQSRVGDTVTSQHHGATTAARRLQGPQADGLLGALPDRRRRLPDAARRARQAPAQRRGAGLRAGDLRCARLRVPLRVPRPAAHGDRPRAARARVRPRPDLDRAQRGLQRAHGGRHRAGRHQPERVPRRRQDRRGPRAGRQGHDPEPQRLHRRDHGALPVQARAAPGHGLPLRRPGRDALHPADGRDRLRLLRPAEVAGPRATPRSTTSPPASRRPTWSRSTSCCRASRSTRSARSCTATRRTPTA